MSNLIERLRQHALPDPHDEREVLHAPLLKEAAQEIETMRRERDELLAAINKFLSDNNPEGFGCACEPNRLCGPCSEAKRQAPLYAAIAKVKP